MPSSYGQIPLAEMNTPIDDRDDIRANLQELQHKMDVLLGIVRTQVASSEIKSTDAARLLGVSPNIFWSLVRDEEISPLPDRPRTFLKSDVMRLRPHVPRILRDRGKTFRVVRSIAGEKQTNR